MNKKDILELKRRLTKDGCTITQMCGCYVNSEKSKISLISVKNFLNMDDEEFYKYLDIAKKTLSGKIGNNLIPLEFPIEEESNGGKQQFLMGIRSSRFENEDLMDRMFDRIIDTYDNPGNYLILFFHDTYDVICKTSDGNKLDESEEIFDYILCSICPVELSAPALGYRESENRIAPRIRDWVVKAPETGFLFPSFSDRSTDIHSVTFYTKDTKKPHEEFVNEIFGCDMKMTSDQKKEEFSEIVLNVVGAEDESDEKYLEVQKNLNDIIEQGFLDGDNEAGEKKITKEMVEEVLEEAGVSKTQAEHITDQIKKNLPEETSIADIVNEKALKDYDKVKYISAMRELLAKAANELAILQGEDSQLVTEIRKLCRKEE